MIMEIKDMRLIKECPNCELCGKQIKDAGAVGVCVGEVQYGIKAYVYYHIKCVKEFVYNEL